MKINLASSFYYQIKDVNFNELILKFNSCKQNILRNNENLKFYAGEWVKVKVNDYISHFVKPAETLQDIAEKYNLDKQKILLDNNLSTEHLFIGQCIKILK